MILEINYLLNIGCNNVGKRTKSSTHVLLASVSTTLQSTAVQLYSAEKETIAYEIFF